LERRVMEIRKSRYSDTKHQPLLLALSRLQEVETYLMGDRVVLRGTVSSIEELSRIEALKAEFADSVTDQTLAEARLIEAGRRSIQDWIESSGLIDQVWI